MPLYEVIALELKKLCDAICARADAAEVQRVGKVLVLWRPKPDEGTGF